MDVMQVMVQDAWVVMLVMELHPGKARAGWQGAGILAFNQMMTGSDVKVRASQQHAYSLEFAQVMDPSRCMARAAPHGAGG